MNTNIKRPSDGNGHARQLGQPEKKKSDNNHYKPLQNEVQFQLKTAHQDYINDVVSEDFKRNSKKFWSHVKNKDKENAGVAPLKSKKGYLKSDVQSKTEILNDVSQHVH